MFLRMQGHLQGEKLISVENANFLLNSYIPKSADLLHEIEHRPAQYINTSLQIGRNVGGKDISFNVKNSFPRIYKEDIATYKAKYFHVLQRWTQLYTNNSTDQI